jgi:hypothetical protein
MLERNDAQIRRPAPAAPLMAVQSAAVTDTKRIDKAISSPANAPQRRKPRCGQWKNVSAEAQGQGDGANAAAICVNLAFFVDAYAPLPGTKQRMKMPD